METTGSLQVLIKASCGGQLGPGVAFIEHLLNFYGLLITFIFVLTEPSKVNIATIP